MFRRLKSEYFCIATMLLVFLIIIVSFGEQRKIKRIDLSDVKGNSSIIFTVDKIECSSSCIITGIGVDQNNVTPWKNWVAGEGNNIYKNIRLLLKKDNEIYCVRVVSTDRSMISYKNGNDLMDYTFKAEVPLRYYGYRLGLLSYDQNDQKTFIWSEEVVQ